VVIGEPTGGGYGYTDGGTPTTLAAGKGTSQVPDCARFRADGSYEVMGIQPDILVGFAVNDGPQLRAARFLTKLPDAVARVLSVQRTTAAR